MGRATSKGDEAKSKIKRSTYGQLLTWTLAHQANEKVDTCSPVILMRKIK